LGTCPPGSYAPVCNHVLAVLYKNNYAYNNQYIPPACTSVPQGWNKGTQKEVNPSKVKSLTFRPKSWPQSNIEENNLTPENLRTEILPMKESLYHLFI
jgi:hypothetical protein